MNKYGLENFTIEEIEQCSPENVNEKEQYYIKLYHSFIGWEYSNGYNATLGGDSRAYCDYNWVLGLWNEGKIIKEIAEITQYDRSTVRKILYNYNITKEEIVSRQQIYNKQNNKQKRPVAQIDIITDEIINIFPSIAEASRFISKTNTSNISGVCRGVRKTAYGFKWRYIEE